MACIETLLRHNADVNIPDGNQDTPLHWAVFKNKTRCVRTLLENGARVNSFDTNNDSPLSWAAQKGNLESMRLLLQYNARVDSYNLSGQSPLWKAARLVSTGLSPDNDEECLRLLIRASGQFDLREDDEDSLPVNLRDDARVRDMLLPLCRRPRRLQQLCRFTVRSCMPQVFVPRAVLSLPLPRSLQDFLQLTDS